MFKTHLDVGFTGLAEEVLESYTNLMVPRALEAGRESAAADPAHPFVWTLPAWLLSECLRRLEGSAAGEELARRAREGMVRWHALPFTTHTEAFGLEDFIRGLYVARSLGERFGRTAVAAKMTDVPGHTWILPTLLAAAGVTFLHLGCNACSTPPTVPPLFHWEGPDGSRVTTMYSPGGYGTPLLPPPGWNLPIWLALQHTSDNAGPQRADTVKGILDAVRGAHPGAKVTFGGLDEFARALSELEPDLPVVRKDLADTWIHGVGSMPGEVSRFRRLRNRLVAVESALALDGGTPRTEKEGARDELAAEASTHLRAAYGSLLVFGEHTWGMDTKLALNPAEFGGRVYEKEPFRSVLASGAYRRIIRSWDEKRERVAAAEAEAAAAETVVAARHRGAGVRGRLAIVNHHLWPWSGLLELGSLPSGTAAFRDGDRAPVRLLRMDGSTWADLEDIPPLSVTGIRLGRQSPPRASAKASRAARPGVRVRETRGHLVLENDLIKLRVDRDRGITSIVEASTGREWVDGSAGIPFGAYRYDVYSKREIVDYLKDYAYDLQSWYLDDFGKPGYPEIPHFTFEGTLAGVRAESGEGWARLRLRWKQDAQSTGRFGNASEVVQEVALFRDRNWIDLAWRLSNKEECPFLEAGHLVLPFACRRPRVAVNKTGCVVDPSRDIAANANHGLHSCDRWLDVSDARDGMLVIPFDTPLFSVGAPGIARFEGSSAPRSSTIFFNLFNNQWGTNFPQWIGGSLQSRVRLVPHPGDWRRARAWIHAGSAQQPPGVWTGAVGAESALLHGGVNDLQTVTLKLPEAGEGIVLRVQEPSGRAGRRVLRFRLPVGERGLRIVRCSLLEDEKEPLPVSIAQGIGSVALSLRPFEVVTLKLFFEDHTR